MSTATFDNFQGPSNRPANFPFGITLNAGYTSVINNIGIAGGQGFGVGICPGPLPSGMAALGGTTDPSSDNYGNYQYSDGSTMVWIPAFYYKVGTGSNGLTLNKFDIKPFSTYADVATANAAGYALHRAFYDGGAIQYGVFVDKYIASNNGGIASSLKNGVVLASAQRGSIATTAYATLTGAPANNLGGSQAAAKTRGSNFFCNTRFIFAALAMLSVAHGQSATATTWCGWYDASGVKNFPKGCNNNALGDAQDSAILYVDDGTATNCAKTGSANLFNRTTHNGQNSGIADLNGLLYETTFGLTSDGTNYYLLNTAKAMKNLTGGSGAATDLFGAAGLAANYTSIGGTYGAMTNSAGWKYFGSAAQVMSEATSGTAWAVTGLGIPLATGVGGTNLFGNDGLYDSRPNELAPYSGGVWSASSGAGVWAVHLYYNRSSSDASIGFRSALYL